jgi:hypothetical protein
VLRNERTYPGNKPSDGPNQSEKNDEKQYPGCDAESFVGILLSKGELEQLPKKRNHRVEIWDLPFSNRKNY